MSSTNQTPDKNDILAAITAAVGKLAISDIAISSGDVIFAIEIDPKQAQSFEPVRVKAEQAVAALAGVNSVRAVLTAERHAPPTTAAKQPAFSHKISNKPVAPNVKHIIAVASGKGGVGKSTVSANLALALSALGKKTGLCDADIYGASQPRMMGLRTRPETDDDGMIIPPQAHGIKIMSMGFFVEEGAPVIWRGPMVHSAIQQLLRDVDWGDLDVLVIDLPPGTGDAQLSLAQYVPLAGAVIVSTPQEVALSEAKKAIAMFGKTNVPVLGMVENMSFHQCVNCGHREHIFDHGKARATAADLQIDFLGEIPLTMAVREHGDGGMPIVAADPSHPASDVFKNIAARVWMKLETRVKVAAV